MATNPFVYSRPVEPGELIDRQEEAARLVELAEGGHHSRLSAPRRYGKTSLLGKVRVDAEGIGMASVYVNFYGILSTEDAPSGSNTATGGCAALSPTGWPAFCAR